MTRTGCEDPHVERMIEAFALVAGRIQHKIDEEFPEITQALLDILYPHLSRQVPAMAIVQFEVDAEQSKSATGHVVPRGSMAYSEPWRSSVSLCQRLSCPALPNSCDLGVIFPRGQPCGRS